jgi:hypothetical protein
MSVQVRAEKVRVGYLPVQQATQVELFLNLKTAKMLRITVPLPLSGAPMR